MPQTQKIFLIFTRDFNLWSNQMVRHVFVNIMPSLWHTGLKDQIIHYTGRTFEWIRYREDFNNFTQDIVSKKIDDSIFNKDKFIKFNKNVDNFRKTINVKINQIDDELAYLGQIKQLFISMYPYYVLGVFLPGLWQDQFTQKRGKQANPIIDLAMQARKHSEGLIKENDLFMRQWLGPRLAAQGRPQEYLKLLSIKEIDDLIQYNKLPPKKELEQRAQGFVYIDDKIYPATNYLQFFSQRNLELDNLENADINIQKIKGQTACPGDKVQGKIKSILNQSEVKTFKKDEILLTAMTSPEFLPAMKKAKAIITDEGGVTCHAAIVSRELNIPCVIGTKVATKSLKDGDLVEVDTHQGIIRKIK